jgi:disulfide bond formation protein DsbB
MRTVMTSIFLAAVMSLWQTEQATALPDTPEPDDFFGQSTATGDFNADGFPDLAVGVPFEEVGASTDAGAVHVLYGSSAGLSDTGSQVWHQDSPGIADDGDSDDPAQIQNDQDDQFGRAVAVGDFNGDGSSDLAVGVPSENVLGPFGISLGDAGAVYVLYGSSAGLSATGSQVWHQDSPGVPDDVEINDSFGASLAAADFGNSSQADLAVGSYREDVGSTAGLAGVVHVLYGSSAGLSATGSQLWHQDSPGIAGDAELNDFFGFSLAAANFGNGSQADLAVGAPYETVEATAGGGVVHVLYGSSAGLSATGSQLWHQDSPDIEDDIETNDSFGAALAAADFGNGSPADLAVGVYSEDVGVNTDAGAVHVLYGSSAGLSTTGNQFWHLDSTGIAGDAEPGSLYGWSLAAANFGSDPRPTSQ